MDLLLLLVTILLSIITVIYFYLKWKHSYWERRNVPQLDSVEFFYGNARGMIKGETSIRDTFFGFYKQLRAKGYSYGGIYNMYREVFVPVHPEIVKKIMQEDFECFSGHFPAGSLKQSIFFKNLFDLEGDNWRWTRKQLTPAFTSAKMRMMYDTMWAKMPGLDKMILECYTKNEPVNIKDVLDRFTIEIVASVGFGVDCNAIEDPNCEFVMQGKMLSDPPKQPKSLYNMFLRILGPRRTNTQLPMAENFFKNMVEENIAYREKNQVYRKDFLHMMIQLKNRGKVSNDKDVFTKLNDLPKSMDIEEITAQVILFYNAGYETSTTTLSFAIFELTQQPDIQDKIREEANRVTDKYDGVFTYDAVMELTYTEQVIEETMRKHPAISIIPRSCTKQYNLPGTDVVIEKGTSIFIPVIGFHMDSDYFPDPEMFDPDRFSPENRKHIRDFTYMPFGEGPRMCIGLRFALMQTKVTLASLLRNHSFTLNKKTTIPFQMMTDKLISRVNGGIWVDIQKFHT